MIIPPPNEILKYLAAKGHDVFVNVIKPYNLNIVGFRNRFARTNRFDDVIAVYWAEGAKWNVRAYPATTYPGTDSLLKPWTPHGTAILVPGQYTDAYRIGKHQGKYPALVQVKPVSVYRDNDKDQTYDKDKSTIQTGLFGINIHRASLNARLVGPNSAGCQVIQHRKDYAEFMQLCNLARQHWGNSFTYTLVEA